MTTKPFIPARIPTGAKVPAAVIARLETGAEQIVTIDADVLTPHAYATTMAKAKYLRHRGIRAAYRNNYTAPRRGGFPYSYGETIVIAKGAQVPEGFTVATAN